mgnify:CR=1 FL=1
MKGYKGFNKDMTCRNKQYAENTVFEEAEGGNLQQWYALLRKSVCGVGLLRFCWS